MDTCPYVCVYRSTLTYKRSMFSLHYFCFSWLMITPSPYKGAYIRYYIKIMLEHYSSLQLYVFKNYFAEMGDLWDQTSWSGPAPGRGTSQTEAVNPRSAGGDGRGTPPCEGTLTLRDELLHILLTDLLQEQYTWNMTGVKNYLLFSIKEQHNQNKILYSKHTSTVMVFGKVKSIYAES